MKILSHIKNLFLNESPKKSDYILYRIISYKEKILEFQYINSRATFFLDLESIINRKDILYCISPPQSCFIGVEFSKFFKLNNKNQNNTNQNDFLIHRYGKYKICYEDLREKYICFIDKITNKEIFMNPIELAERNELIQDFDAAQAFYIGFQAGYLMKTQVTKKLMTTMLKKPHLRLVK